MTKTFSAYPLRLVLVVLTVLLSTAVLAQEAPDDLTFSLDWTIYGTHAPFYLALEEGYYADQGINLSIVEGQGSATVSQIIADGSTPVGFVDYAVMAKGVAQGMPIKAVFGVNQTSPMIIVSHADNPIEGPEDLAGKVIAMAPAESTAQIFPALLAAADVDPSEVSILNPAVGAKNSLFLLRRADAIPAYVNVQVAQLEAQGADLHYFSFADYGVNTLSNGIIANTAFLENNGDLVRRFLDATARGWQAAKEDPEAAIDALLESRPEFQSQRDMLLRQLELTFPTLETSNTAGQPLGWMSEEDWRQTVDILSEYAGLENAPPLTQLYTNEYIPE